MKLFKLIKTTKVQKQNINAIKLNKKLLIEKIEIKLFTTVKCGFTQHQVYYQPLFDFGDFFTHSLLTGAFWEAPFSAASDSNASFSAGSPKQRGDNY